MFNISVVGNASFDPLQRAIATKILMEQANSSQITQAMNSALVARGRSERQIVEIRKCVWVSLCVCVCLDFTCTV